MIIDAGSIRSGSGILRVLIKKFLRLDIFATGENIFGASQDIRDIPYWNQHLHNTRWNRTAQLINLEKATRQIKSARNDTIFIVKTHNYAPELVGVCNRTLVLVQDRDLRNVVRSMIGIGILRNNTDDRFMMQYIRQKYLLPLLCWESVAVPPLRYEDLQEKPMVYLIQLGSYLAHAFHNNFTQGEIEYVAEYIRPWLDREGFLNTGSLRSTSAGIHLSRRHEKILNCTFQRWLRQRNYSVTCG